MLEIPYLKEFFKAVKKSSIDDLVDRTNYFWTTLLLAFFALVTGGKQTFGKPIECMMPGEYPGTWNDYVREFCYVTSTYMQPITNTTSIADKEKARTHGYYQWVPFILMIQALCMYLPHVAWKAFQRHQPIDFQYVVEQSKTMRFKIGEERQKTLNDIITYLKQRLHFQSSKGNMSFSGFGLKSTSLHLFSKFLTLIVIGTQLFFMNSCFGYIDDPFWGVTMFKNALTNNGWQETGIFPRVTYCDFYQPILGGKKIRRTVQCVLMANMLNEKIFVFLWFWMAFVLVLSILNIFYVIITLFVPCFRVRSARYLIKNNSSACASVSTSSASYSNYEEEKLIEFADALGPDGTQLFQFIRIHSGAQVACQIATALFNVLFLDDTRPPSSMNDSFENNKFILGEKQGKSHC